MTIWQLLNVSAAAIGLVIIVVMAAIPFLTDERGRASSERFAGARRPVLGPPPHPPRGTA
jgi:hypothetical protein